MVSDNYVPVRRLNISRAKSHLPFLFDMLENRPSETSTRTSSKARLLESIQLAAVAESSAIEVVVRIFEISGERET